MTWNIPDSDVRESILAAISVDILEAKGLNAYGSRFEASISITGLNVITRRIRTAWIVLEGERGARFVTAFPDRKRRQAMTFNLFDIVRLKEDID